MTIRRQPRYPLALTLASLLLASSSCPAPPVSGSTDSGGDTTESGTGDSCEDCPQCCSNVPQWVLRDKDGARIDALVQPRCGDPATPGGGLNCRPLDFDSIRMLPCVRVLKHGDKYINLQYELSSGKLEPCQLLPDPVDEPLKHKGVLFLNAQCEGQTYRLVSPSSYAGAYYLRVRDLIYADGDIWYQSDQDCIEAGQHYSYSAMTDVCTGHNFPEMLCPLRPVPQWVRDLLPNPPYTLALEYE